MPTLLLWGLGLAALTPAVVSAAIASLPADRAGLASGINNTARQAGGAIGIAAYGAVTGPPGATEHFIRGLHVTGPATTGLWLITALGIATLVPRMRRGVASVSPGRTEASLPRKEVTPRRAQTLKK